MRKRILLAMLVVASATAFIVAACASIPRPGSEDDSLVVGSLVLDFPDGFFDDGPRTLDQSVAVEIENMTEGRTFTVITEPGGYFSFLSDGKDLYSLRQVRFTRRRDRTITKTDTDLDIRFTASPHAVLYLGHIVITYVLVKRPSKLDRVEGHTTIFEYDLKGANTDRHEEMLAYLRKTDPKSPWAEDYEIKRLLKPRGED